MTATEWGDLARFACKIKPATAGCWMWTKPNANGYGKFRYRGKVVWAHRWAYEHMCGPIPTGTVLDHLCRVPACVNPDHLEPVTHQENCARGYWGMRTHCPHGHPYDEQNTRRKGNGNRACRTCIKSRRG